MSSAQSHHTSLGMVSEGKRLPLSKLPTIEHPEDIHTLPMAWQNPVSGKYALQVDQLTIRRSHLQKGTAFDDLGEVTQSFTSCRDQV